MNDDSNARREELEQKLTALLLGELDPREASMVMEMLARDGELAQLHDRLRRTLGLVREATAQPTEPAVSSTELPSMDPARREHVLRVLRSNPPPSAPTRVIPVRFPDSGCSWYAWLAIAACVVFLLGAALWLLGNSSRPRRVALVESEPARASEEPAKLGRRESLGETVTVAQSPGRRGAPASSAAAMSPEAEEARDAVSTVEEVGQTFRFYDSRAVNDAPPPAPPEFRRTARGRSQEPGPPRANSIVPQLRIPAQQRAEPTLGDTPQFGLFFSTDGSSGLRDRAAGVAGATESMREESEQIAQAGVQPRSGLGGGGAGGLEAVGGVAFGREGVRRLTRMEAGEEPLELGALFKPASAAGPIVTPSEVATVEDALSTFSLNVTDVSFRLAQASLANGVLPPADSVRSEEFLNAFDYRDPEATSGVPLAFNWERARYPFAHNRDVLRLAVRTGASGREPGRPLNLVLAIDNSGSMERADRVRIIRQALQTLAAQLKPEDRVSVVAFARTTRLWVDGLPGDRAGDLIQAVGRLNPEGGTNLEDALRVAYETAIKHFLQDGVNRVVLLTDGAANLGELRSDVLRGMVESHRRRGIALDCFGIGWDGYNDDLLEALARNGDGRYGFLNTAEEAATGFADKLAGAFQIAAEDVKVQVEFNPRRVSAWRQIGYDRHRLTQQQFRDNTVDAAELGAAESGNALYIIEVHPRGEGPIGLVRVRYRVPGTNRYDEREWFVPYTGVAPELAAASSAMRLATVAGAFAEWLAGSPLAAEVTTDQLLALLNGVPAVFEPDPRPGELEAMIRQAKSISGR